MEWHQFILMNFLRYYAYYIFLHLTLVGSSLLQVGDAVSVNLDSSATYKHSSNITKLENAEKADGIYTFSPGAVINIGKSGTPLDLRIRTKYDIISYDDYNDLDINRLKIYFDGDVVSSERLNSTFSFSDVEGQSAITTLSLSGENLVETTNKEISFNSNLRLTPKLIFSLGINQSERTYDTLKNVLSDRDSTNVPIRLIYEYSDKLSVLYGINLNDTKIFGREYYVINLISGNIETRNAPTYDTESVYYSFGLRGDILPKLTGQFDLGYHTFDFSTPTNDFDSFGLSSQLTWDFTPKLKTAFIFNRNFDVAGTGRTFRSTQGFVNTSYSINNEYRLSFSLGHTGKYFRAGQISEEKQKGRGEKLSQLSINLSYTPSGNYSFSTGYNYVNSDARSDYSLSEFIITGKLKY